MSKKNKIKNHNFEEITEIFRFASNKAATKILEIYECDELTKKIKKDKKYSLSKKDIIFLLFSNKTNIYITVFLLGFGRAISEYGAAAIVGGSIDHFTRNMTATIALETSKGNVSLGIVLGTILISLTLLISISLNFLNKNNDQSK